MTKEIIDGQVVDLPLKATVGYTRKVGLPNYSNVEASVYLPVELQGISDDADVATALEVAKATVLTALGLEHAVDEKGNVTEAQAVALVQQATGATKAPNVGNGSGSGSDSTTRYSQDELRQMFAENPGDFYDNRPKKASGQYKSNASDAKHKASGQSLWNIDAKEASFR